MIRSCAARFDDNGRSLPNRIATGSAPVNFGSWSRRALVALAAIVATAAVSVLAVDAASIPQQRRNGVPFFPDAPGQIDGDSERKLLGDLAAARDAFSEHHDPPLFARDLAAAFRRNGLDLDRVDPKVARERLGNRTSTALIASEIDSWSFMRRIRLERLDCRPLANVARAIDHDPWRNSVRDQIDRREADAISVLRRCASDTGALEKQPVQSLLLLALMLDDVGDGRNAASVVRVRSAKVSRELLGVGSARSVSPNRRAAPDPNEAANAFGKAVALRPSSFHAHAELGEAFESQKKFEEAIAEYRETIRLNPSFIEVYGKLAELLVATNRVDDAIAALRSCIRLNPGHAAPHSGLGGALVIRGDIEQGIAECREAIRLDPNYVFAYLNLAGALSRQGKTDAALEAIRDALQIDPSVAEVHFAMGRELAVLKKGDEAAISFRRAIKLNPKLPDVHSELGMALRQAGKLEEALGALREATRRKPDDDQAHYRLGVVLYELKRLDEAIAEYRAAIRIKSDVAWYHYRLAGALDARGKHDEAIAECKAAIRNQSGPGSSATDLG